MAHTSAGVRDSEENRSIQEALNRKAQTKRIVGNIVPYIGLVFIFVFFVVVTNGIFISPANIDNLVNQGFALVIIAVGASFVYAHGGMDFSIAATSGVTQLVCCFLLVKGLPLPVAILACILTTMVGSAIVAGITVVLRVPVFIGSICVRTAFAGILATATERSELAIDFNRFKFMNATPIKVVVLIVFIALGYYLFNCTIFGKYNKAIGGNMVTAIQAGIKTKKFIIAAFLAMGLCVGVASVFFFFRSGRVTAGTASGLEFNMMMAIILGGFPLSGGERSKISSAIVGALTVTMLSNGLLIWGLDPLLVNGVKGVLFVAIVALSYDRSSGKLVS